VGHSRTSRDPAGRVAGHLGVLTCAAWPTDEGRTERGFLTRAGLEKTQLSGHSGELEEWSVKPPVPGCNARVAAVSTI
jgi:hypothetical protein